MVRSLWEDKVLATIAIEIHRGDVAKKEATPAPPKSLLTRCQGLPGHAAEKPLRNADGRTSRRTRQERQGSSRRPLQPRLAGHTGAHDSAEETTHSSIFQASLLASARNAPRRSEDAKTSLEGSREDLSRDTPRTSPRRARTHPVQLLRPRLLQASQPLAPFPLAPIRKDVAPDQTHAGPEADRQELQRRRA